MRNESDSRDKKVYLMGKQPRWRRVGGGCDELVSPKQNNTFGSEGLYAMVMMMMIGL